MYQRPLPEHIKAMTEAESVELIAHVKRELGEKLVVLGHHYQRDDVIQFADYTGDSLKLSQLAAAQKQARYIVFCGVHFMAESADILTAPDQVVLLPDLTAGCSMADMADLDQVEDAWEILKENLPLGRHLVPVTYVNSSASIKAFCGRHAGLCCTSSNCQAVFGTVWTDDPNAVIFFLPDEHLGRNTAYGMGVDLKTMPLYDPFALNGDIGTEEFHRCRVVLWKGFCSVHGDFKVEQIEKARSTDDDIRVIVHPECTFEVVQQADFSGSTAKIVEMIQGATAGSHWIVGTEINLVKRLAEQMKDRGITVRSLNGKACPCATMYRIDLPHLAWIMEQVHEHSKDPCAVKLHNQIVVESETKSQARLALDRMMAITATATQVTNV